MNLLRLVLIDIELRMVDLIYRAVYFQAVTVNDWSARVKKKAERARDRIAA